MKNIVYILTFAFLFYGCNKQELDLDIIDKACEKVSISNIKYTWKEDPSPDANTLTTGQVEVTFDFDGDERCVEKIGFNAQAYNCNNGKVSMGYNDLVDKSKITVNGSKVTVLWDISFSSVANANALNHIIVSINTENDLGDKSDEVEIRVNATESVVKPSNYEVNNDVKTVRFSNSTFRITLWDHAAEDGDIVSVYLNGEWIIENFSLLNADTHFNISRSKLNLGTNHLVVFAQNEGSVGANTASIAINGSEVSPFSPGLSTGEAVQIRVN